MRVRRWGFHRTVERIRSELLEGAAIRVRGRVAEVGCARPSQVLKKPPSRVVLTSFFLLHIPIPASAFPYPTHSDAGRPPSDPIPTALLPSHPSPRSPNPAAGSRLSRAFDPPPLSRASSPSLPRPAGPAINTTTPPRTSQPINCSDPRFVGCAVPPPTFLTPATAPRAFHQLSGPLRHPRSTPRAYSPRENKDLRPGYPHTRARTLVCTSPSPQACSRPRPTRQPHLGDPPPQSRLQRDRARAPRASFLSVRPQQTDKHLLVRLGSCPSLLLSLFLI